MESFDLGQKLSSVPWFVCQEKYLGSEMLGTITSLVMTGGNQVLSLLFVGAADLDRANIPLPSSQMVITYGVSEDDVIIGEAHSLGKFDKVFLHLRAECLGSPCGQDGGE